ncbi:unnamed protein product [Arabidopsis halleri]
MIKSVTLRSFHLPIEFNDTKFAAPSARSFPVVRCSSTRDVPKLELFSRGKFDRILQDPPLIEKAETELSDYCSTLEGDDSYSCWRAYFELKDLEREKPKVEVENLILQTGGVKSLIGCLHGVASSRDSSFNEILKELSLLGSLTFFDQILYSLHRLHLRLQFFFPLRKTQKLETNSNEIRSNLSFLNLKFLENKP